MNWSWLTEFFSAPAKVVKLQKALEDTAVLLVEARGNFSACQLNARELKATCDRRQTTINNLTSQRDSLTSEIQALKEAQNGTEQSLHDMILEKNRLQTELEAEKNKPAPVLDITPEKLETLLKAKYQPGTDVAKIWDAFNLVLVKVFAIDNGDSVDFKIFRAEEYLSILAKAFPEAKFISEYLDNFYYAPDVNFLERAVRNDFGNLKPFGADRRDCDDFAEDLRAHFRQVYGYNIGVIVLGDSPFGYHAWILLFGFDGVLMVEPQTDQIVQIPDILAGYIVRKFHTY